MARTRRITLIERTLRRGPARTQEQIVRALEDQGVRVTQATVSRDLASLGAVRGPGGYRLPGDEYFPDPEPDRLREAVRAHAVSVMPAASLVVLKTAPGHADVLATELDAAPPEGVAGCIAGDDTIFLATHSTAEARRVAEHLHAMMEDA